MTEQQNDEKKSYRGILKATSLIGSSSIINILIGMVRTKFVAILLGPAGVGLIGMFNSITGMISTIASMGIGTSGVRSIAEQHGKEDAAGVSTVVQSLRRTVWGTGLIGLLATIIGAPLFSKWTFGNYDYTVSIMLLGITILLGNIAAGQNCVIQGTRRIADLAKISILGSFNSTIIGIPLYYLWGVKGIVPSLILGSVATLITTWYFARRVEIQPVAVSWQQTWKITKTLLGFGFPLMLNGLVRTSIYYFIRLLLLHKFSLDDIGIYSSSFAISSILVDFVLGAMMADYYPRLTGVAHDNQRVKFEVDSQAEIALLLATPAIMVTLVFAPLGIWLFYSSKFAAAVPILRWSIYGIFGRIISWPLSIVILAKGMGKTFFISEVASQLVHLGLLWVCTTFWGLNGTGIAFALNYLYYCVYMLIMYRYLTGNTWTLSYVGYASTFFILLIILNIATESIENQWLNWTVGLTIILATSIFCLLKLKQKTGFTYNEIKNLILRRKK